MDKSKKSQISKLSLIVAMLISTPILPTSLRSTYLYFVFNLFIISIGAEAGLLSFFSKAAAEDKETPVIFAPKPVVASESSPHKAEPANATGDGTITPEGSANKPKVVVEKCSPEKIVSGAVKVKKCPSTPSLFFIGDGGETEVEDQLVEDGRGGGGGGGGGGGEEEDEVGVPSGQELFTKAETFIGNFYKQLKMQREDSWKRIHGLYHYAF